MKIAGYDACYAAIMDAKLENPIRYESFTTLFDTEKLDEAKNTFGTYLYDMCLKDATDFIALQGNPHEQESRVEVLAKKIQLPENAGLLKFAPKWVADSLNLAKRQMAENYPGVDRDKAEYDELAKQMRLRYILNHLCPNLHHFHPMPRAGMPCAEYNEMLWLHITENSQKKFTDGEGSVLQEGVFLSGKEFDKLISIWKNAGAIPNDIE